MTDDTLIADLIRAGVDPNLVQRVATAIIEAKGTAQIAVLKDESAERRRAADRARKAVVRSKFCGIPQNSTYSADTNGKPLPLPLPPQTPPSPAPAPAPPRVHEAAETLTLEPPEPKPAKSQGKGTQQELEAYAVEIGLPASDGTAMFDHWSANGWRNGQAPSKCWKAGMRKWKTQGWLPSQKLSSQPRYDPHRQTPHRTDSANRPGRYA